MKKKMFSLIIILIFAIISCGSDGKKTDYDVVIVGAGGGGLATAARLTLAKKRVLLIEQHSKAGGYMGSFSRGDYTFEISLHAMDGLDPECGTNVHIFNNLGIYNKVKPIKMDPMYKVIYPGLSLAVPADAEEYKKILLEKFPKEKEGIENFYTTQGRFFNVMNAVMEFQNGNYLSGFGGLIKSPVSIGTLLWYMNSTTADYLNEFFTDKLLISTITALTGMLGDGPDDVSCILFATMWNNFHRGGYYYFAGGSESIVTALEEVIEGNSGEIILDTLVTKILVEEGAAAGVRTEDGKTYTSKYVVSNANAPDTFSKLVGKEHLDGNFLKELYERKVGASIFNVYLGVKKDYNDLFAGTSHQIIVNESDDYMENFKLTNEGDITKAIFGMANYSNLEPDIAPRGKNVISIITIMPYNWHNGWNESEGRDAYKKLKTQVAMKLLKRAEEYLPGLSANIEEMEIATPRTNEHYTLNYKGSIFGWANSIEESMLNRLPQATPIDNLYLAGAWTFPAGGQSAVLMSGLTAANMIIDKMD